MLNPSPAESGNFICTKSCIFEKRFVNPLSGVFRDEAESPSCAVRRDIAEMKKKEALGDHVILTLETMVINQRRPTREPRGLRLRSAMLPLHKN